MAVNQNQPINPVLANALQAAMQTQKQENVVTTNVSNEPSVVNPTESTSATMENLRTQLLFINQTVTVEQAVEKISTAVGIACGEYSEMEEAMAKVVLEDILSRFEDQLKTNHSQEYANAVNAKTLLDLKQDIRTVKQGNMPEPKVAPTLQNIPLVLPNLVTHSSNGTSSGTSSSSSIGDYFTVENILKFLGGAALGVGVGYGVYQGLKHFDIIGGSEADFNVSFDFDV